MTQQTPEWPPRDEQVSLAYLVSHHVREYPDHLTDADPIGPLTIGQHLVPLVDSVLQTALLETAGRGAQVATRFNFIDPDQPQRGARLGIAYDGQGPSAEDFEDEATPLGGLRQKAAEAGGVLALTQDETGTPQIELTFPFRPEQSAS